jgi:cell division transport system ATP-binding protein
MERPSAGNVFINGVDLNKVNSRQIPYARRDIGIIFQNHRLLERYTVFDNVALPLIIEGTHRNQIAKRVHGALDKVGLIGEVKCHPSMLSGGEQQRVGIARAIVNSPPILLADEPTGNLDPELSMEILKLFEDFNKHGTTVLIATHDLGLVARMKYRSLTLKDGRMLEDPLAQGAL